MALKKGGLMRHLTLAGVLAALTLLLLLGGSSPAHATTQTFTMTIDDNVGPASTSDPPCDSFQPCPLASVGTGGDDCVIGVPCEMYQTTEILAADPFELADTSIPKPKFTIAPSYQLGGGVPNGTQIGAMGFTSGVVAGTCIPGFANYTYPAVTLIDAALPDYTTSTWVSGGMDSEGPNVAGAAAMFSPVVWPLDLESDAHATALNAAGYPLIARYYGTLPTGPVPTTVNILVFETPTSYVSTTILGDPTQPPPVTFCTPATISTDFLGSTNLGVPLHQCNAPGIVQVAATFIPSATVVNDPVSCSGTLPSINQSPGDFCIVGTSTNVGWKWRLLITKLSGPPESRVGTVSPPVNTTADGMAAAWATNMKDLPGGVMADVVTPTNCFHVSLNTSITGASSSSSFILFVAPLAGLECEITTAGCSFNPIVYYVPPVPVGGIVALSVSDSGSPFSLIPLAVVAAAALVVLSAGLWYGRRRWLR
jgi:hypothetical protein